MTTGAALTVAGGSLQLVGLLVAGRSVYRTRKDRAQNKRGVWGTGVDIVSGAWRSITNRSASAPAPVTAPALTAVGTAAAYGPSVTMGPPTGDASAEDHLRYIEGALVHLQNQVDVAKETMATQSAEAGLLGETVQGNAAELRKEIDSAVTDDLAGQTLGLWVTALGAVLAVIGACVGG